MHVIHLGKQTPPAEIDYPREDRRVDGVPERTTWTHYSNASGALNVGIWACEKGSWQIRFAADSAEFFCIISGRVRVHADDGSYEEFGPGDAAVIPEGFVGKFEVLEPVKKYFVVLN